MKKSKETKSSAFYQQQYRQRLREQGLIKKEVWILPEHTIELLNMEKQLRVSQVNENNKSTVKQQENNVMKKQIVWSVSELYQALTTVELFTQASASVELIDGVDACLHVVMHEYGDLPLFMSVSNQQIVVEALLWPTNMVKNQEQFNQDILYSRKLFPLSTIAIEQSGDGSLNYIMYGALSASSSLSGIVYELEMLSDNVIKATEAYHNLLNFD
ncbi:DUF2170 family protein [Orbus sturtevantii]|uniref:YjfI family protein n=1 Tax=Orbus sturtevantii TaxID=3074109 RepID=UPI00370D97B8